MAHHAIALYVGKQLTVDMFVAMPLYSEYSFHCVHACMHAYVLFCLLCTHYPYFICLIAVILNTLYAFYVLCLVALHLFVGK